MTAVELLARTRWVTWLAVLAVSACGRLQYQTSRDASVPDPPTGVDAGPSDAGQADAGQVDAGHDAALDAGVVGEVRWSGGHGKHVCAAFTDGRAFCAGLNNGGQLGAGVGVPATTSPVPVAGEHAFASVSVGDAMACGVGVAGDLWCWGVDGSGQLGNGAGGEPQYEPSAVIELPGRAIHSANGTLHTCAVFAAPSQSVGRVHCWGQNGSDLRLGIAGTDRDRPGPETDLGGPLSRRVACGFVHSCALTETGEVHCWGSDASGQVTGVVQTVARPPTRVARDALVVVTGEEHTCVLHTAGTIQCWGDDEDGQHGDGVLGGNGPSDVLLPEAAIHLVAGQRHNCAIGESGAVYCWGYNVDGQVAGAMAPSLREPTPIAVAFEGAARSLGASETGSCVALDDGTLTCWGNFADTVGTYDWTAATR